MNTQASAELLKDLPISTYPEVVYNEPQQLSSLNLHVDKPLKFLKKDYFLLKTAAIISGHTFVFI